MRTACGIVGIVANDTTLDISDLLAMLHTIQHRGQSSWGAACLHNGQLSGQTQSGLLPDKSLTLRPHPLACCIGHVGDSLLTSVDARGGDCNSMDGAQPVLGRSPRGKFAVAFNGRLGHLDSVPCGSDDSPVNKDIRRIVGGIANHPSDSWIKVLHDLVANFVAAFTLVLLTDQGVFYARDLRGYRPLVRANLAVTNPASRKSIVRCQVAVSEDCGYLELRNRLAAQYPEAVIEIQPHTVQPGTIGHIRLDGKWKEWAVRLNTKGKRQIIPLTRCSLEAVHFMDSAGEFDGLELERFRNVCGRELAVSDRTDRDVFPAGSTIVVGCPRSGILSGKGYAAAARLPYVQLIRAVNKVSRVSTQPTAFAESAHEQPSAEATTPRYQHRKRKQRPRLVLTPDADLAGKTVVVVDDILITGHTIQKVVELLRPAHPTEIHVRIAAPAIRNNCSWGAVIPDVEDLLATTHAPESTFIAPHLGVNSLKYLSVEQFGRLTGPGYCQECFFTPAAPTAAPADPAPSPRRTRAHTTISLPGST